MVNFSNFSLKIKVFSDTVERDTIKTAMEKIANNTCIRLIPRTNQPDYAEINNKKGQGFDFLNVDFEFEMYVKSSDVMQVLVDFLERML